jgi:hypothetical protein|tara:strand:+ start:7202 stop:7513 length:312 start_codon:yes stop_codon:yes gene_type:complete
MTDQVSTDAPNEATPQAMSPDVDSAKQATGLQISDMQTVLNIIDLASTRGAFRSNELSQVGAVADKLGAFLQQINAQAEADKKAKEEAEGKTAEAEKPAEAKE